MMTESAKVRRNYTEKERRIYYQNIVYAICNEIDADRKSRDPGVGLIACGTVEHPSTHVQWSIIQTYKELSQLRGDPPKQTPKKFRTAYFDPDDDVLQQIAARQGGAN